MQPVPVDDVHDPRLAEYQNLKDSELAQRHGRFIVEGPGPLEILLNDSRYAPRSILLSEKAWRTLGPRISPRAAPHPVFVAPQPVLDAVVGFAFHRGVLAVCDRPAEVSATHLIDEILARQPGARFVVTEAVGNHDNMGSLFRNARAFGAAAVLLCPRSCDPLYRKAVRTSAGGALCVPFARAEAWPSLLGALRDRGVQLLALDPGKRPAAQNASTEISNLTEEAGRTTGPAALLVGAEGPGLSAEALALSDRCLRIDMEPGIDSINVAMAAGIALHALRSAETREMIRP